MRFIRLIVTLGWSELTTVWIQKYVKSCCHKTTWALISMTPHHLLETPAFTQQQGGWVTVHKRHFFLKEQRSAVYLLNSVNSASVHRNWTWVCFVTSWGHGLNRNRMFFVKYALKSRALYAATPLKTAKHMLLLVIRWKAFCHWILLVITAL